MNLVVKKGDVVSFTTTFQRKFKKADVVHRISGVRRDLVWEDVVSNFTRTLLHTNLLQAPNNIFI